MRHYQPDLPFILVGTKLDQKISQQQNSVSSREGEQLAEKLHAENYFECSAKTRENLKDVFVEAAVIALRVNPPKKKRNCIIL